MEIKKIIFLDDTYFEDCTLSNDIPIIIPKNLKVISSPRERRRGDGNKRSI